MRYIASCSGGKDSVAMVLELIRRKYPLDAVITVDLGAEFKSIYTALGQISALCAIEGIPYKALRPEHDFRWYFAEKPVREKSGGTHYGYSWCGGRCRWGTALKRDLIARYYRETFPGEPIAEYVGIAADERERVSLERGQNIKIYPLILWGMTENDCLVMARRAGFRWREGETELYDVLERVSCFCCANKNLAECRAMIEHLPEYWQKIRDMERLTGKPFKGLGTAEIEKKGEQC